MKNQKRRLVTRRQLLATTGACAVGIGAASLGLSSLPKLYGSVSKAKDESDKKYFPPSEQDGGWRVGDPWDLKVDGIYTRLNSIPSL